MSWAPRTKRLQFSDLLAERARLKAAGRVVVWTNGTFDLLHPGHVASLQQARALGDVLVVGLNSDSSVKGYKGPTRPILTEDERAALLAALECVDYVTVFDEPTPEAVLAKLQPDVHCKGAEYAPPHGRPVPERATVEGYGGRVAYLPLVPGLSSTDVIARVKAAGGMTALLLLDRDGTLMEDVGYPNDPEQVRLLPSAPEAVRLLVERFGFVPAVVSNQSGLARGRITPEQAAAVHDRFVELFAAASGLTLPCWYCPHGPEDGCDCRKPMPGLLRRAAADLGLSGVPGVMVGDKPSDVDAGRAAGYDGLLFAGDWEATAGKLIRWHYRNEQG